MSDSKDARLAVCAGYVVPRGVDVTIIVGTYLSLIPELDFWLSSCLFGGTGRQGSPFCFFFPVVYFIPYLWSNVSLL